MVIVDPGHGGRDPGAVFEALREKDITLAVADEVTRRLWSRYTLIRNSDVYVPLQMRCEAARPEDLFLSIHCNAGGGTGPEVWIWPSDESRRFARILEQVLCSWHPTQKFRGVKETKHLYVLRETPCPAALVELGFIDSPLDSALLDQFEAQQRLGELLALASDAFLLSR